MMQRSVAGQSFGFRPAAALNAKFLTAASALIILCGYSTNALGCFCGMITTEQAFQESKVVFVGRVTKIERAKEASVGLLMKESGTLELVKQPRWEKSKDGAQVVTLEVIEAFKGTTDRTVSIMTSIYNGGGTCGVNFKKGESYLVFALERQPQLSPEQANLPRDQWTTEIKLKASADEFNTRLPALETSTCIPTQHMRWATDDIKVIRRVLKVAP